MTRQRNAVPPGSRGIDTPGNRGVDTTGNRGVDTTGKRGVDRTGKRGAAVTGLRGAVVTGKLVRQLCGTVLIMEAVIIGLAIPVAITLEHLRGGVAGGVGGALALCALVLGGLVGRRPWAFWAGSVLQALVIAAGSVISAMYILGVIFGALWITGIWLANRLQSTPPPTTPSNTPTTPGTSTTPTPTA